MVEVMLYITSSKKAKEQIKRFNSFHGTNSQNILLQIFAV